MIATGDLIAIIGGGPAATPVTVQFQVGDAIVQLATTREVAKSLAMFMFRDVTFVEERGELVEFWRWRAAPAGVTA